MTATARAGRCGGWACGGRGGRPACFAYVTPNQHKCNPHACTHRTRASTLPLASLRASAAVARWVLAWRFVVCLCAYEEGGCSQQPATMRTTIIDNIASARTADAKITPPRLLTVHSDLCSTWCAAAAWTSRRTARCRSAPSSGCGSAATPAARVSERAGAELWGCACLHVAACVPAQALFVWVVCHAAKS